MEGFRTLCSDDSAPSGNGSNLGDDMREVATYDSGEFRPYTGSCDPVSPAKEMEILQRQSRVFKPSKGEKLIKLCSVFARYYWTTVRCMSLGTRGHCLGCGCGRTSRCG